MQHLFLTSLNEAEFKTLLKEVLTEGLKEVSESAGQHPADVLNVTEAATFLRLQVSTLYEKTATKSIPHFKKGNRLYFYRNELEEWLRGGKVKTLKELQGEAATYVMHRQNKVAA
jgi:excisionase family DNA binding protein